MTGGSALFSFLRNGKPKPPTVTGVFLFAKTMITIRRQKRSFFVMDSAIFDSLDSPGGIHHPLTIAIYAFICHMDGKATREDIKKAFKYNSIEMIDFAISILDTQGLITIENQ